MYYVNRKWLLTGLLINAFIMLLVYLSVDQKIYSYILALSLVLFIISYLSMSKNRKLGIITGTAASVIMVLLFIKGFFREIIHPSGLFDLPTISNIICPLLYSYIIYKLLFKTKK